MGTHAVIEAGAMPYAVLGTDLDPDTLSHSKRTVLAGLPYPLHKLSQGCTCNLKHAGHTQLQRAGRAAGSGRMGMRTCRWTRAVKVSTSYIDTSWNIRV